MEVQVLFTCAGNKTPISRSSGVQPSDNIDLATSTAWCTIPHSLHSSFADMRLKTRTTAKFKGNVLRFLQSAAQRSSSDGIPLHYYHNQYRPVLVISCTTCFKIKGISPMFYARLSVHLLLLIKRYNLYKVLACSTAFFQLSLCCAIFFQLCTFIFLISSKTSFSQRVLGLPIGLLDMGYHLLIF